MIVKIEKRPRIITEVIAKIDGKEYNYDDIVAFVDALDVGDFAVDEDDREIVELLTGLEVIAVYDDDGIPTIAAGPEFETFKLSLETAVTKADIEVME